MRTGQRVFFRRIGVAVAAALVVSVVSAGVLATPSAAKGHPPAPPVPVLKWAACGDDFPGAECAVATVPLDYDKPTRGKTQIALAPDPRVRSGEAHRQRLREPRWARWLRGRHGAVGLRRLSERPARRALRHRRLRSTWRRRVRSAALLRQRGRSERVLRRSIRSSPTSAASTARSSSASAAWAPSASTTAKRWPPT